MSITTEIQRLKTAKADSKTAIEEKGVQVGDGLIDTYAEKIREISVGSVGDNPLDYARTITFANMNVFGKAVVELNIGKVSNLDRMFYGTTSASKNTIVERLTIIHNGQPTSMQEMICTTGSSSDDSILKKLTLNIDTSKCQYFKNFVRGKYGLTIIDGTPFDFSSNVESTITTFTSCGLLTDFRVVKETIKQSFNISSCNSLSNETIENIIEGLADLTGKETQTLSLSNAVGKKLTDEQKAIITAKNWTLAY
jgi:hypothetical protein